MNITYQGRVENNDVIYDSQNQSISIQIDIISDILRYTAYCR